MRLVQHVENPHISWHTGTPGCEWRGINCNNKNSVLYIKWSFLKLGGKLNLKYLPPRLVKLDASSNNLYGEFLFGDLPPSLEYLMVPHNKFSGTPMLHLLPPSLKAIEINNNNFGGRIIFSVLPVSLCEVNVSYNKNLEGTLDIKCHVKDLCYNVEGTRIKVCNGPMRTASVVNPVPDSEAMNAEIESMEREMERLKWLLI